MSVVCTKNQNQKESPCSVTNIETHYPTPNCAQSTVLVLINIPSVSMNIGMHLFSCTILLTYLFHTCFHVRRRFARLPLSSCLYQDQKKKKKRRKKKRKKKTERKKAAHAVALVQNFTSIVCRVLFIVSKISK